MVLGSWARKPKESSHQVKARAWQGRFASGDRQPELAIKQLKII